MNVIAASDRAHLAGLYRGGWDPSNELIAGVSTILADVRARGDAALVDYTRRFDDPSYDRGKLRVGIPMLPQARSLVPAEIADALALATQRVARFHEHQRHAD